MSKRRLALYASICFFVAGALLFYAAIQVALPSATATQSLSTLQVAIHTADQIEISFLADPKTHTSKRHYSTKAFHEDYAITSTRLLSAEQTKELLEILDSYVFSTSGGAMCHDPGFLLRFRRQGRDLLTGSLCLHCTNLELEPFPFSPILVDIYEPKTNALRLPRLESFFVNLNGS